MLLLFEHNAQERPTQEFMQNRTDSTSFFKSQSDLTCERALPGKSLLPCQHQKHHVRRGIHRILPAVTTTVRLECYCEFVLWVDAQ